MFYKGTKVIGKTNLRNHIHNEEGVVIREPSQHDDNVGVQFKNKIRFGHDGNGLGRDGHCYFCHQSSLKIISGSNISISDITTEFEHKQFKRRN